jgi:hypothetical protein
MNEMTIAELDDEICSLAARISAATARLLMLVGEFDAREGWAGYGVKSCAHWLSWKCQIGTHAAREQVRVARALRDLPVIRGEFCAGQLSYAKVRALTRIAAPDIEPDLVELARSTTAAQLERTAAGWRRVETLDDEARSQRRALTWHFDEHGMLHVKGCLDAEEAAVLLQALEAIAGKLDELPVEEAAPNSEEPAASPWGRVVPAEQAKPASRVDALTALARSFLNGDGDTRRDPATQLVVTLEAQALERNARAGLAAYRAGGRLTSEQARRLACDSALVVMLKDGTEILDVGRSTRTVPRGIRRALLARDRGCAMPGCTEHRPRKLHAHHVWHWADGGPTALDNLILLCKAHHHLIHHNGFTVVASSHGFVFRDPEGTVLQPAPALAPVRQPLPDFDHESLPQWNGDALDLDYVLTTLMQRRAVRQHQRQRLNAAHDALLAA